MNPRTKELARQSGLMIGEDSPLAKFVEQFAKAIINDFKNKTRLTIPPRRPWVWMTKDEVEKINKGGGTTNFRIALAEELVKEKNCA